MMSGRHRITYTARILSWEDGKIRVRDIDQREHILKEVYIRSMKPVVITGLKVPEVKQKYEQQELFSEEIL